MAGFGDSRKLAGQFYFRELTVFNHVHGHCRRHGPDLGAVGLGWPDFSQVWVNPTYLGSGIVGGLIMGVGFIIGGFARPPRWLRPPPARSMMACSSCSAASWVPSCLPRPRAITITGTTTPVGYGRLTLDQVFGIPAPVIVLIVVCAALFFFWGSERVERAVAGKDRAAEPGLQVRCSRPGSSGSDGVADRRSDAGGPIQKLSFQRTETIEQRTPSR